ncbi:MAG: glycosyltransferase family 39 protein, partial [Candidatus Altiarchaeota archaeon]|nr:glycosyltransferase family 39 protein [Candidatus Altiarchaeota archaeon]
EPAHRLVFGYGIVPWELVVGMRSMVYPYFVALLFKILSVLGVNDPMPLIFVARIPSVLCSVGIVYVTYLLAARAYSPRAGFYAGFFTVFSGFLLGLSAQVMGEVPAMFLSLCSIYFFYVALKEGSKHSALYSGFFLGLAFMFRFAEAIYVVPLVLIGLVKRRSVLPSFLAAFIVVVLAQGVVDYFSWGTFLHSPFEFVRQNIVEGKSAIFGSEPFYYYAAIFVMHLPLLALLSFSIENKFESKFLAIILLFYFAFFSLSAHKELRFMATILPLFFVLSARGLERAREVWGGKTDYAVLSMVLIFCAVFAFNFPWSQDYDYYAAMRYVGSQSDSTGVAYDMKWFESGAYTFLHKEVPVVHVSEYTVGPLLQEVNCTGVNASIIGFQCAPLPAVLEEDSKVNYFILSKNQTDVLIELEYANFKRVKRFGGASVYRRFNNDS